MNPILKDALREQSISVKELSKRLQQPYSKLSATLNGYVRKPDPNIFKGIDDLIQKPVGFTLGAIMKEVI